MKAKAEISLGTKPSTLADGVFDQIRTAIIEGELEPGAKINEPQLSKQYGISRGPLREAIRRLEGCKLVEIKPNIGANIVSLNISQINEINEFNSLSNKKTMNTNIELIINNALLAGVLAYYFNLIN